MGHTVWRGRAETAGPGARVRSESARRSAGERVNAGEVPAETVGQDHVTALHDTVGDGEELVGVERRVRLAIAPGEWGDVLGRHGGAVHVGAGAEDRASGEH